MAVWFGLLAGIGEVAILWFKRLVFHSFVGLAPVTVWLSPLGNVLMMLVAAGCLIAGWRLAGRSLPDWGVVAVCGALGASSLLLNFHPQLHKLAILLLALGVGRLVGRSAKSAGSAWFALARRTLPAIAAAVAIAGVVTTLIPPIRAWWSEWKLPAARVGAPNVLLLILDTVRASHLSAYGYRRPTSPNLERLAAAGVRFRWAIAPAPWTLPSHASIFTGKYPQQLSASWWHPLDEAAPTLAETLRDQGYRTAGFVANKFYAAAEHGLARGFSRYEDRGISLGELAASTSMGRFLSDSPRLRSWLGNRVLLGRRDAGTINRTVLSWFDRQTKATRPYFVFINYFDAHDPYIPPPEFAARFGPVRSSLKIRSRRADVPDDLLRESINAYDACLAAVDDGVGRLLRELEQRGALGNTLIIVTSDHGEEFGEHDVFGHGLSLYLPVLHVPLVVSFPRTVPAGRVIDEPVSLRDLAATIVDLTKAGPAGALPGASLRPLWEGATSEVGIGPSPVLSTVERLPRNPSWAPSARGNMASLVAWDRHVILDGGGREETFSFREDSLELRALEVPAWSPVQRDRVTAVLTEAIRGLRIYE